MVSVAQTLFGKTIQLINHFLITLSASTDPEHFGESCVTDDHFTCDDINVRKGVFTQLQSLAVPLERLAQLLLDGCRSTQPIETHHLETQRHK